MGLGDRLREARRQELAADLVALISPVLDREWYLEVNKDVRQAGLDPVEHYLEHGHLENRNPSRYFETRWYRETYLSAGATNGSRAECPLVHYMRRGCREGNAPHPLVDTSHIAARYGVKPEDALRALILGRPHIDELCNWFSRTTYLEVNTDVAKLGDIAAQHYLTDGLSEGRRPHPGYRVLEEGAAQTGRPGVSAPVGRFSWGGKRFIVERTAVSADIANQIIDQGAFDPQVFAPGHRAVANLVQTSATDIAAREQIDYRAILDAIGERPDLIVLHPGLCLGGAEAYTAQLVATARRKLGLRAVVITTQASEEDDRRALRLENLSALRSVQVVSIGPELARARLPHTSLALLLIAMAPKHLFVINSSQGLEALRWHGRAIGSVSQVLVSFFSESPNAYGSPYATQYLFDIIENARVFADNQRVLDLLSARLGHQVRERFVLLPQTVSMPTRGTFERDLAARTARHRNGPPRRILWLSRWSPYKATDVVVALARRRPDWEIDVFGVPEDAQDFPPLRSLHRHGITGHTQIPLEVYDAYMFTSRFEGMPNVVLEMAARGVPCVCSDVGGLREVFDEACMDFVAPHESPQRTAEGFEAALEKMFDRSVVQLSARVRSARAAVEKRCAADVVARRLGEAVGVPIAEDRR